MFINKIKRKKKGKPRRWKRNNGGDNFHPSNGANHRPREFYYQQH